MSAPPPTTLDSPEESAFLTDCVNNTHQSHCAAAQSQQVLNGAQDNAQFLCTHMIFVHAPTISLASILDEIGIIVLAGTLLLPMEGTVSELTKAIKDHAENPSHMNDS
ncbi:hypothetical protein PAXRUDRAFT_21754 [Paxillus rubicundulus Ve08.2h10]|uniref:Uncharacterized protein n=1 Tax=Paxillus rubicundulus Ve08.2h10 TaxID=930991 RepID=A0A0D0CYU1_9AGAM|nr:hypothetical protein PAXRUDRAFT_21754 [Paxillus rubicundulus Ve08.2h10]